MKILISIVDVTCVHSFMCTDYHISVAVFSLAAVKIQ